MSTKKYGNKLVSDLSKLLIFTINKSSKLTAQGLVKLLVKEKLPEQNVRQCARRLQSRGLISGSAVDGYKVTAQGLKFLEDLRFDKIQQTKPWDKKWRIVIFDIPETKRNERDKIRQLLKELGFYKLQLSTWAHPLPCLNYFKSIQKSSRLGSRLILMEVDYLSEQTRLLNHFRIKYPGL